ncbi:MAG: pyridoxal-phosphate dependent enzyme [Chlamydiales bacterium]|nr:pyridoxal-phosphate dependent enzyme [Chlamydiia bacterium]MCP5507927.1 pyridoxal-phosphate dependent enzyme [Chlamydiales bacterium]
MIELIKQAAPAICGYIRRTPMEKSLPLSEILGTEVYLKCEHLQVTGSFKIRGACFRLLQMTAEEKKKGVLSCSAGNHGKALAYMSQKLGIKATIFVPSQVDPSKLAGIIAYGAEVIRAPCIGYDETEHLAKDEARMRGIPFISPFDDDCVMAGNGGTLAMEIIKDVPDVKMILTPVGGGGLCAGLCCVVNDHNPTIQVIGCQHEGSPALHLSLQRGEAVTQLPPFKTLAAGVEGGIGARCFDLIKSRIAGCCLVDEDSIIDAVRWCLKHHQYLIEPSAAVTLAAILNGKVGDVKGPIVVILSGRNVSIESVKEILR